MDFLSRFTECVEDLGVKINNDGTYSFIYKEYEDRLIRLYFEVCEKEGVIPFIEQNLFSGQLEVCCHIIDYSFNIGNIQLNDILLQEIEGELVKKITNELLKNITNSCITLDVKENDYIYKIMVYWDIRK